MDTAMEVDTARALVTIKQADALTVYTQPDGLQPYLAQIKEAVAGFVGDPSTAKGRAEIRSTAHKVIRSKTYLEDVGAQLSHDLKSLPKKIDASRKLARDTLSELAEQIRKPLTDWEAEQARIKAEADAKAEAEKLAAQIEHDHELGLLMNAEHDRLVADAKAQAEAAAVERERQAREDGERRAREEAEAKVVEARVAAKRAEQEKDAAQQRAEAAEREQAEQAERSRIALEEANKRAEQARAKAIEDEREAVAQAQEKAEAEARRRQEDHEHRRTINREVLAALIAVGITEDMGKNIVLAIASGKVPRVSIAY